jgi:hypothetical protein
LEGNIRYNIYRVTSSWCKTQERSWIAEFYKGFASRWNFFFVL